MSQSNENDQNVQEPYGTESETRSSIGIALSEHPASFQYEDIETLVRFGLTDDWERYDGEVLAAVVRLRDGRYAALEGGCDYTGWDCQSSLDVTLHDSAEEAWLYGITQDGRSHIERAEAHRTPPGGGSDD